MKIYNGSGILPIIIINKIPYFITFLSRNGITDAGGIIEKNNSVEKTSIRELFEESAGLIKIKLSNLKDSKYIDIRNKDNYYRVYFIILNEFEYNDFYINLKKIRKFKFNPFLETYSIKLIKLDIINYVNNNILLNSISNEVLMCSPRLKCIIRNILKKYNKLELFYEYLINNIKPIILNKKNINVNTYEYDTHKKIKINNLITYNSK